MTTARVAAEYLAIYAQKYREEYARIISDPPFGAGYPDMPISPYLHTHNLICYLALDGCIIVDGVNGGKDRDTYVSSSVCRISNESSSVRIQNGQLPVITGKESSKLSDGTEVMVFSY